MSGKGRKFGRPIASAMSLALCAALGAGLLKLAPRRQPALGPPPGQAGEHGLLQGPPEATEDFTGLPIPSGKAEGPAHLPASSRPSGKARLVPFQPDQPGLTHSAAEPFVGGDVQRFSPQQVATALVEAYGRLPLSFEPNQGQTNARVKFLSRGAGYTLFLTDHEAVLALSQATENSRPVGGKSLATRRWPLATAVVRMKPVGANPAPQGTGLEELPGKVNYFIGNDPAKWRTDISAYAKVKYEDVYPGISLVYHGNQRQLEYDFVVAPGANPGAIRLAFTGAQRTRLTPEGDLLLSTRAGQVRLRKPEIYQQGSAGRREIVGRYRLGNRNTVSFELGPYDSAKELIIDPVLVYSTLLGGAMVTGFGGQQGMAIAADSSGSAYVTGFTFSTAFPTTPGAYSANISHAINGLVFVTKFNPSGTALLYSSVFGGSNDFQEGFAIAVDGSGNAYVTGFVFSTDFPTTPNAFRPGPGFTPGNGPNAFVTKLNSSGSGLSYSTYLGGSGNNSSDQGTGIAVDSSGNAYITGSTASLNFPTTAGAFQTSFPFPTKFGNSAFVTSLNSTGTALNYSTFLGGNLGDDPKGIALDSAGNAYVAGGTASTNFPTTPGAFQVSNPEIAGGGGASGRAGFVTKLNSTGSALVYSTYLGGSGGGTDEAHAIAVDSSGDAFLTGSTTSFNFPTTAGALFPGPFTFGGARAFVTKFTPDGKALLYSTYLSGTSVSQGFGVAVDSTGLAWVTGQTSPGDFPVTPDAFHTFASFTSFNQAFVTRMNAPGTGVIFSTSLGGSSGSNGGIALDPSNNVYVTGFTGASDFPTTPGAFQTTRSSSSVGNPDAFVVKISQPVGTAATATTLSTSLTPTVFGQQVSFTASVTPTATSANTPSGIVTFKDGGIAFASVALSGGAATFSTAALTVGSHNITASYGGDNTFAVSTSAVLIQTVNQAATMVTLAASPNPANPGQSVTLTATVKVVAPGAGTPSGTVTFLDGTTSLGAAALNSAGAATFSTTSLSIGAHSLAASYSGDSNFTPSMSAAVTETVNGVVVNVNESITVSDTPSLLPSAMINVPESIRVTDVPTVLPPAVINVMETITVTDAPTVGNTPVGVNVGVIPIDTTTGLTPVTVTYGSVTQPGITSLTTSSSGALPPAGFQLGSPAVYYNVVTSATFTGTLTLCINYTGISFATKAGPKLFHFENGTWVDRTVSVDTVNKVVCGAVSSLSPFALFEFADKIPPTTTASLSPPPNAAGWNNRDVTVTLSAMDELGGSGVKQISFSATGAQIIPATTSSSASASFIISAEGITTITFFGTDNAGNIETAKTVTIKLDKTPPTLTFGPQNPPANAAGWNNTNVSFSFTAKDDVSGVASTSIPSPLVLTAEGRAVVGTVTVTDLAGNSATFTSPPVNIDKTPPTIVATRNPLPNANGWNNTDVTVSFTATDALSGVAFVTAPVTVTSEGAGQRVTGTATDVAGNSALLTVILNIDKTPPEAFSQFDPVRLDLVLFGRDSLSGVPPGPVTPVSVVPAARGRSDKPEPGDGEGAELRTYKVMDLAGNFLLLVEKVKREGDEIKAQIVSLQYNNGPVLTPPRDRENFEWALKKDRSLRELEQKLQVGIGEGRQELEAKFEADKNQTVIKKEQPKPETRIVKPGLVLLRMATKKGKLALEF